MSKIIEFNQVALIKDNNEILKDISFIIDKGDLINIIGPNGAGKTSLIKLLINEYSASKGSIVINSYNLGYMPQKQQNHNNFPITVCEFLYTGFKHQNLVIKKEDRELMKSYVKLMDLETSILNESLSYLSGGELQRIYFIRALVSKPEILILDEPTSALDSEFRTRFYQILKDLNIKDKVTIIHITHDVNDNYLFENSKIIYIDKKIKFNGSYQAYKELEEKFDHAH